MTRDCQGTREHQALRATPELLDPLALPAHQDLQDTQDLMGRKAIKAPRDPLDHEVIQDLPDCPGNRDVQPSSGTRCLWTVAVRVTETGSWESREMRPMTWMLTLMPMGWQKS